MIYFISIFLALSIAVNILLVWYAKKLSKQTAKEITDAISQLRITSENIEQMQLLFEEYADGLKTIMVLEQYHDDEILKTVIGNTNMVTEMCKAYKKTIFLEQNKKQEEEKPQDER